ncbi:MAG: ABC transporter ATP-binding protein, partial [Desulforhabdus sp.]|nr:ABC transporter ATP-binding protein [Desulforhabdus sp.]
MSPLLQVKNLQTFFFSERGVARAVDRVSLALDVARVLGVVGESGCGKSVTALSIMRLIQPPGKIVDGEIWFNGVNLVDLSEEQMRSIRGNEISMIFQEPMTSLNPVFRVRKQIAEVIQQHEKISKQEALERVVDLLTQVGIPAPQARANDYPHQMSGGMRQRVMIAIALACSPRLIIADEPTTALDVTIQ